MAKFITVLLADAALETFPEELLEDRKVRQFFSKMEKTPNEVLLDVNYHSHFLESIADADRRGRPDIIHFSLLSCFGSILARENRLKVLVHTYNNEVIEIEPTIRLPKNVERFNGLILQLFKERQVPPDSSDPLMTLSESTLAELVKKLQPKHDLILEFSAAGEQLSSSDYSNLIFKATNPLLIFGAYPHGKIRDLPTELVDKKIAIYGEGLDLFAVISQILASQHMIEQDSISQEISESTKLSWE